MRATRRRLAARGAWRRSALAPTGVVVAVSLLVGSAALGLRLSGLPLLPGEGDRTSLDYSAQPGSAFPRLRPGFIADVLGGLIPDPAAPPLGTLTAPPDRGGNAVPVLSAAAPAPVQVSHPFTNTDFAHAYVVPSVPFTAHTDTTGATREPGEPGACAPVGGVAWYRYTPASDAGLLADTFGSSYPLSLGVFEGTSLGTLEKVGCDTGPTRNAQVGFAGQHGHTYYFQIAGTAGSGALVFNIAPIGRTLRTTDAATGGQSSAPSGTAEVSNSADGRYVAFDSGADLDPHHTPQTCEGAQCISIYVADRTTHLVTMASISSTGVATNGYCLHSSISAGGRYVAFSCTATNLVPGRGSSTVYDVYVHDLSTGVTTEDSLTPAGREATPILPGGPGGSSTAGAIGPSISADGRYVSFIADFIDLVPGNPCRHPVTNDHRSPNSCAHVYLHDRVTGKTTMVDAPSAADVGDGDASLVTVMSQDSTHVLYVSDATNLVPGAQRSCVENTDCFEAYEWNRLTGRTTLVSVSSAGSPADRSVEQFGMSMNGDGRLSAFQTQAGNLVAGDTNAAEDAFVHDLTSGVTLRVSVTSSGGQVTDTQSSNSPGAVAQSGVGLAQRATALSADGRYVFFVSGAPGVTPNTTAGQVQIYRHDLVTGATIPVSITSTGQMGDAASGNPAASADGSILSFSSASCNLAANSCTPLTPTALQAPDLFDHVIPENGE